MNEETEPEGSLPLAEPAAKPLGGAYTVLARKYRPRNFSELIGQKVMVRTLRNAFAQNRIAHAFMLTGVRGVGKTTTARILARALNYAPNGSTRGAGEPTLDMTEEGEHCAAILESRHLDVVEMDAASNTGIDDVREIIEAAKYWPNAARFKVYIVDEVHMLSKQAFNGLLKTLEEPPAHVKFIFATTELRKVPVTVLSRCQRFDLKRVDSDELVRHLERIAIAENAAVTLDGLALIARAAEGSVRDALSLLDRAIAYGGGAAGPYEIRAMLGLADRLRVFDLLESTMQGDASKSIQSLALLVDEGAEPVQILADLADAVHQVTRVKSIGPGPGDASLSEAERARVEDLAKRLSVPALARAWQMLLKGHGEASEAPRPLAAAEMVLIRLAFAAKGPTPGELARQLQGGAAALAQAALPPRATPAESAPAPMVAAPASAPVSPLAAAPAAPPASAPVPPEQAPVPRDQPPSTELNSFDDVIALAGKKRDLKLKRTLTEHIRLVSFAHGTIEFALAKGVSPDLGAEIGRKLTSWTGTRWIAILSEEEGEPTRGDMSRTEAEDEMAIVRDHPVVREVLAHFPDARIASVRPAGDRNDEE